MHFFKSIITFSVLFLLIGSLPAWAQGGEKKMDIKAVKLSEKAKTSFIMQLKALRDVGPAAQKAAKAIKSGDIKGFNIGMPPGYSSRVIHIIFAEFRSDIRMKDRSDMDAFKASSGLTASFKRMGVNPAKGMAFQYNPKTMKLEPFSGPSGTGKKK